jgi:hypothetical protein
MTALQRRFKNAIARIGDAIDIDSVAKKAVVTLLSRGFAYSLMDLAIVEGAARPMRLAYLPFDDDSEEGDSVEYDGDTFELLRIVSVRTHDQTVVKMLAIG